MAVGPIGSAIFTNQMTPTAASVQGNQNNRFDLQNLAAQAEVNKQDEKVLEVRPAEENHEVDEDREHQRDEAERETERSEHEEEEEEVETPFKLDIKV
ncbi:hypothetical protein [Sulfurimonas sp.]